ncbi:MAG: hypothetical protein J3R72DRAFT_356484, partial [Linnemannia gamsii]
KSSLCSSNGQVILPSISNPPPHLLSLYSGGDPESNRFLTAIRMFNNLFAFVSTGADIDTTANGRGPGAFRLHGELYHQIGSLLPGPMYPPKFAQVYVHDPDFDTQLNRRLSNVVHPGIKPSPKHDANIVQKLQAIINTCNPYAKQFTSVGERLRSSPTTTLHMSIIHNRANNDRTYSLPTVNEIALIIPGPQPEPAAHDRDIIVQVRNNEETPQFQRISAYHPSYWALAYPLLFP